MKQEQVPEIIYPEHVVGVLARKQYQLTFGSWRAAMYHQLMYKSSRFFRWSILGWLFVLVVLAVVVQILFGQVLWSEVCLLGGGYLGLCIALLWRYDPHKRLVDIYVGVLAIVDHPDMDAKELRRLSGVYAKAEKAFTGMRKGVPFLCAHNSLVRENKCGYLYPISKWQAKLGFYINLPVKDILVSRRAYQKTEEKES